MSRNYQIVGCICFFLVFQGCASAKKVNQSLPLPEERTELPRPLPPNPPLNSTLEAFGPPPPEQIHSYGPEPIQLRPLVLVLGPGLARGFVYAGVFRALKEAKIPVGAIFGTEIGGLIGALYAKDANLNQFEWGFLKFKEEVFQPPSGLLARIRERQSGKKIFETRLLQIFGEKDLKDFKIPLKIAVQIKSSGIPMILEQGRMTEVLRAAMANPKLFPPAPWRHENQEIQVISAEATRPFLVREARESNLGPVVVIDVLNEADSTMALDELKEADLVIRPDVRDIQYMDFRKKTDAAFRGKSAIILHMPEIKQLVGMPESDLKRRGSNL